MNVYLTITLLQYKDTDLPGSIWELLVIIPYSTKTQIPLGSRIWLLYLLLTKAFLFKKYLLLKKITEFTKHSCKYS